MTSVKLKTYSNSYGFAIPKDFFELVGFEKNQLSTSSKLVSVALISV
ncbi:hypothetical protein WAX86_04585 [Photobacterium damselae subsp. damselae]